MQYWTLIRCLYSSALACTSNERSARRWSETMMCVKRCKYFIGGSSSTSLSKGKAAGCGKCFKGTTKCVTRPSLSLDKASTIKTTNADCGQGNLTRVVLSSTQKQRHVVRADIPSRVNGVCPQPTEHASLGFGCDIVLHTTTVRRAKHGYLAHQDDGATTDTRNISLNLRSGLRSGSPRYTEYTERALLSGLSLFGVVARPVRRFEVVDDFKRALCSGIC